MTQGLRTRATEIVSLDLGPRTSQEIIAAQTREIEQERFTSIDRRLMRDAARAGVVRIFQADPGQHASLIGRLRPLARLGLAEEGRNGRWTLEYEPERRPRRIDRKSWGTGKNRA